MASISITRQVAAPPEVVFEVATDLPHAAEHIRGIDKIELLTPGPIGVGTRWKETRRMMGNTATETLEIVAFDRPRSYTVGCESCGAYMETTFGFLPAGTGTQVSLNVRMEARSLFAKLLSPVGNLMFGKMMRKCLDDDLADIKRVAESRVGEPSSA
jgi:hypothetical protein